MSNADVPVMQDSRRGRTLGWILFAIFLMAYAWAYAFLGSILILEKNVNRKDNIQAGFIDAVYQTAALGTESAEMRHSFTAKFTRLLPQYTDGVVDPLFPWLLQGFAEESPDELFQSGKWMNLILSGGLLIILGIAAARSFSFLGAAAMILLGGFGVVLERSTFFSSDALYCLLMVLTWLSALSLIRQNSLWLYGVFGVLLGITFLAKAMVWPVALGFVLVSLARSLLRGFRHRKGEERDDLWVPSNQLVGFAILLASFLIVVGPRLSYANERFGSATHAYQNYFIWMDSPARSAQFQADFPTRKELDLIAPGEAPGLRSFLRAKGAQELFTRAGLGALSQLRSSALGRGVWILLYGFLVFLVIAGIHRWVMTKQNLEIWRVRGTSARWMLLFLVVVCATSFAYAGIGTPVISAHPLVTALFMPILVTFIWIAERYRRQVQRSQYATLVNRVYVVLMWIPILWMSVRIFQGLRIPVS
jgi:hypothetical protein